MSDDATSQSPVEPAPLAELNQAGPMAPIDPANSPSCPAWCTLSAVPKMSKIEIHYLLKYVSSGVLNTLSGFAVIFAAMALGISPLLSNIAGYTTGFVFGFVLSKKFVFRSHGHFLKESLRYLKAFFLAFLCNVAMLQLCLYWNPSQAVLGQFLAAVTYTILMYLLVRFYVFRM